MSTKIQPLNGKIAWFPIADSIVEIISVTGRIVTFAMFTDKGLRVNRTYLDFLELLEDADN